MPQRLISKINGPERIINRKIIATWAVQKLTEVARAACVSVNKTFEDINPLHEIDVLHRLVTSWIDQNVNLSTLEAISDEGTGDPNPVLVGTEADEDKQVVLEDLRLHCCKLAMSNFAKQRAVNRGSDELVATLAESLGKEWSLRAMFVYKEGK